MPPAETIATIPALTTTLTWRDKLKRWSLRWGIGRTTSRVEPGLYRIGSPTASSPVLVTCNYRMTVDLVRRDLAGVDCWLLVLETFGVNVWCAAGKGTFGTDELVRRIYATHLADVVDHERIVLPQLGAAGVAAHTVRELTGYRVVWGPIRSRDLPAFLAADMCSTPEMRAVTFTFRERIVLAPVEFVGAFRYWWAVVVYAIVAAIATAAANALGVPARLGFVLGFAFAALAYLLGAVAGGFVVPALLPWLPGRAFSAKGAVAGAILAVPELALISAIFWAQIVARQADYRLLLAFASVLLGVTAMASYVGVNFTGSTPYTSPSGVERELRRAIPLQAAALGLSLVSWAAFWFTFARG